MDLTATYTFSAPAVDVWNLLMSPDAIAACLPGCRELRPIGNDRFEADLVVGVAAVSGVFKMAIAVEDKTPETSYRLVVDGTGRPGFVRGRALVTLEPQDDRTIVHIAADANVGGLMARVGQRLLEGVARMTMDQFYGCLSAKISHPPT
jgi:carbon monoxide dehydrogenase subunit G